MAYIPKGNSAWLLRKAINRSNSAIADLETNMAVLSRTASNTGTSTTTQVLFNDAGIVNGDAGLVYNKTTDALTVGGALTSTTGDISASNGSLKSSGASAGLRITSSTGDMYQTVASKNSVLPNISSITIVFTVATASASSVLVDVQMGVSATFCDFCFAKYAGTATVILRTSASAGITGALTVDGTGTIYTMTIAGIPLVSLMVVALKVSVGGSGVPGGALFTALPVVTFIP